MATDPATAPFTPPQPIPPPGWWSRNWKWFVPTGCLTVLALGAAFIGLIVVIAFGAIKSTDVYRQALARAQADPRVVAALGTPIREGMFPSGRTSTSGGSGDADISIPISGPNGSAMVYAVGQKFAGRWIFSKLVVRVANSENEINLLAPAPTR